MKVWAVAVVYALGALVTFGHSAADRSPCWVNYSGLKLERCDRFAVSIKASSAALFWPLYWSWELQE